MFDLETQELFVSQDVIFYENIFPYAMSSTSAPSPPSTPPDLLTFNDADLVHSQSMDQSLGIHDANSPASQPITDSNFIDRGSIRPEESGGQPIPIPGQAHSPAVPYSEARPNSAQIQQPIDSTGSGPEPGSVTELGPVAPPNTSEEAAQATPSPMEP